MLRQKKSGYSRLVSLVELVGLFSVGTVDLYLGKSWLNRLDDMLRQKNRGIVVRLVWLNRLDGSELVQLTYMCG